MDILLDEAIDRFAAISRDLGYPPPRPVERPDEVVARIEALGRHLDPLTIPPEVVHFWTSWATTSFAVLTAAGGSLHSIEGAEHARQAFAAQAKPAILLPIGRTETTELAVELDAPGCPGARLYRVDPYGETSLIGAGVADLLDLYGDWVDRHNSTGRAPGEEMHVTDDSLGRVLDDAVERFGHQHIAANRGVWPRHWLIAEGFADEWLEPKGPTHLNAEFDTARCISWPLVAVLQGIWRPRSSGPAGEFGVLTDDSGSVELLRPKGIPDAGHGRGGRCEMELVGTPPKGERTAPLPSAGLLIPSAADSELAAMASLLQEMQEAMNLLETSIVATAVRPLDGPICP